MAAWITAATTARQPGLVVDAASEDRDGVAVSMAEPNPALLSLSEEVSRMRDRLDSASIPQETARNPFSFSPPLGATGVIPGQEPERLPKVQSVKRFSTRSSEPKLVGIAVDGDTVTAILTLQTGEVILVGVGDTLPGGYHVERADPRGVTLNDVDGGSHRLPLR